MKTSTALALIVGLRAQLDALESIVQAEGPTDARDDLLTRRTWPGNVRELKNVVERAAILSSDVITVADLPEDPHESPFDDDADDNGAHDSAADTARRGEAESTPLPQAPSDRRTLREYRDSTERAYIVDTLKALEWNISKAAIVLGVERTNLHKKVRAYGIKRGEG